MSYAMRPKELRNEAKESPYETRLVALVCCHLIQMKPLFGSLVPEKSQGFPSWSLLAKIWSETDVFLKLPQRIILMVGPTICKPSSNAVILFSS